MRTIRSVTKAAFKVLAHGIKKVKHKAKRLVSSTGVEKERTSNSVGKLEDALFSTETEIRNSEDYLPAHKGLQSERPFKGPVFVEMGQDPDLLNIGLRKIGKDILFLYDIDDTLYHRSNNLQEMEMEFLKKKYLSLKNDGEDSFEEQLSQSCLYSSLFYNHVGISLEEYWEMMSEFDYLQYLSPDVKLRSFLLSMKNVRRCCFTNGPSDRAENILTKLGILDCFEVVISIGKYDKTFCCKPLEESYKFVAKVLGIECPGNVYFFDDSEKNISGAEKAGWNGVLITEDCNIIDVSSQVLQRIRKDVHGFHFQEVSGASPSKMPSN
ncbi:hypothetical protein EHEL_051280 [Encephalitozoon hellem ATCC 50504]|uniref:HAD hydrolase n=1 Tax=Encephalitozoon hellem TaxID=27973 RepID=A0A9Q9CCA6_ENCHE|nr:uncharacterized protein EHEL_051280 [Encephalitozoon hellem ATCC 50504]AFM98337.1 hypothetical protein EHEL_051280 [Encephalitozoon hellem ATCC 50504]UTX43218.1 HAD hydrolase [Encephalitozoon hellem]|eukprot:XP_003887318.1 hypothetical protein EHEL_051280 [Encephalitozoon hellem ATCC 50504]